MKKNFKYELTSKPSMNMISYPITKIEIIENKIVRFTCGAPVGVGVASVFPISASDDAYIIELKIQKDISIEDSRRYRRNAEQIVALGMYISPKEQIPVTNGWNSNNDLFGQSDSDLTPPVKLDENSPFRSAQIWRYV